MGTLVLTRRSNQVVIIGDNVRVTVLGVRGSQVRIGIEAPSEIDVHREEVYNRIQREGRAHASHKRRFGDEQ